MIFYLITFQFLISIKAISGVKDIAQQFCVDYPSVSIDAIVKTPNDHFYVFTDDMFVEIDLFTYNGYPILNEESPQKIIEVWDKLPNYLDTGFAFDNKIYLFKVFLR